MSINENTELTENAELTETIQLELSQEEIVFLAMEAHKRDITLNAFLLEVINEAVDRVERTGKLDWTE